ncbi:phage distal tail protein [Kitasatospora purpeofusca]|uniref:phage distal tail protein n=1 Tax=Kitasatospora purpeofusca TaxID=67352 RepID=UPI00365CC862
MAGELITRDLQIQWASQLWGDGTVYAVQDVPGWEDLPSLDSGSVPRAQQLGAQPGRLLAQARPITCTLRVACDPADWPAVRLAVLAATTVQQDEQPLVIQMAGQQLLAFARITRRVVSTDTEGVTGSPVVSLLWEASDPRRYTVTEQSASAVLPVGESGLSFGGPPEVGLSFGGPPEVGLSFGSPGQTGDLTATNSGNTDTHPVIEIRGPVTTPTVTLASGLRLEYGIALGTADTLVIDTRAGTVTLGGQDRLYTATARSAPEGLFTLPPGTSTVSFRADPGSTDPAAQATVRWRSAYL